MILVINTLVHLLVGPAPQPIFLEQGKVLGCEPLRHPGEQWQLLG